MLRSWTRMHVPMRSTKPTGQRAARRSHSSQSAVPDRSRDGTHRNERLAGERPEHIALRGIEAPFAEDTIAGIDISAARVDQGGLVRPHETVQVGG